MAGAVRSERGGAPPVPLAAPQRTVVLPPRAVLTGSGALVLMLALDVPYPLALALRPLCSERARFVS